jgi:hypothetical protein
MSAKEIVEKEVFPKKSRQTKWRIIRLFFYFLVFFIVYAPSYLPISFAPEIMHDLLGGQRGALTAAFAILLFALCLVTLSFCFLFALIFRRKLYKLLLSEIFAASLLFGSLWFLSGMIGVDVPYKIAEINNGRQPEEFNNPYLDYKMLDCRNLTEEFDVIFIPRHLLIETEYLAYAPRRKKKTIDYLPGRKYGNDWYWEFSGSQWSDNLRNCLLQNKSPNP